MELQSRYDLALVLLSIGIAIFAAYTSLNLISRLRETRFAYLTHTRVASAALVMGLGIWSMHFVGMLAFILPIPIRYDGPLTLVSLIVAVLACYMGLLIATLWQGRVWLTVAGVVIGQGVASMHFIGMAAMILSADMLHNNLLILLSVLIAIFAAIVALWVAFSMERGEISSRLLSKWVSAVFMGMAIAGMHYTGMAAMSFHANDVLIDNVGLALDPNIIGITLTLAAIMMMSFALWSTRIMTETSLVMANEERVRAITENVLDVILTINEQGMIEFANAALEKTFGYPPERLLGESIDLLLPDGLDEEALGMQGESRARHQQGHFVPVELALSEGLIAGKPVRIIALRDISERIASQKHLQHIAHHDALTNLPNRLYFSEQLEKSLSRCRRKQCKFAILFLDLDRFKVINDSLGHHAGDYLLVNLAQRLRQCLRGGDILSRLSGDEFTILLEDITSWNDVAPIAHKITHVLSKPIDYKGQELFSSVSIGISLFPDDAEDGQHLMQYADIAMYRAKEEGGNRYRFYTLDMNERAQERLRTEAELRHALERNEFELFFQPQVDIENGVVVGTEALLRWHHPTRGLLLPGEFVPLLEETGLIIAVGEWVIRQGCQQVLRWDSMGIAPMQMAVNISARQFKDQIFVEKVAEILESCGLAPERLELEITENLLMQRGNRKNPIVQALHDLGVQLAVDDFGTGYSSLSYLRKFPIHTLKIDRSFVQDITSDADDAAIVQLIIDMSHSLKLNVVAEGVENREQLNFLRERGCWEIQGFYFSPPLAAEALTHVLLEGNIMQVMARPC